MDMTIISSGTHLPAGPILVAGPLTVALSDDPADIDEIQQMRYRVFADEPGFADTIGDATTGRDADRFDEFCEHLVVRHAEVGERNGLIGCARLLPPPRAIAAGGWYTSTEFDVAELDGIRASTVEMGRVCVDRDHRQGSTTALIWAALLRYLELGDYQYLLGCVSVPLAGDEQTERGAVLRGVRDEVRNRHAAAWQVFPLERPRVDGRLLDDIEAPAQAPMPPLLRAYLRLGARVCGEPAIDEDFGVGDLVTVLDEQFMNERYLARLRSAITRLAPEGTS